MKRATVIKQLDGAELSHIAVKHENFTDEELVEKYEQRFGKEIKIDCEHSLVDADNDGIYGKSVCRFCGKKFKK